jgi:hypothetical protein
MRIAYPNCGIVSLVVWGAVCALVLYAAVHAEDATQNEHLPWVKWVVVAVIFGILGGALVKSLRAFPLTYTGGTYRVRRRTLQAGERLVIGPIENIGGRHVESSFYLAMRDVNLRLRPPQGSARITAVDAPDGRPLDRMTLVMRAPLWDSDAWETNWNEIATDIPWKTWSCYVVVESCRGARRMRVRGRIAMCLPLRDFLHPPDCDHFRDCRIQVNPPAECL